MSSCCLLTCFNRDSGGAIKELNKIAFKHPLTFEEGKAFENQLVDALCKCDKLKTFVAKVLPTLKKIWPFADANYCGVGRTSSDKD